MAALLRILILIDVASMTLKKSTKLPQPSPPPPPYSPLRLKNVKNPRLNRAAQGHAKEESKLLGAVRSYDVCCPPFMLKVLSCLMF